MAVSFGRSRKAIPPSNLGAQYNAQRRVSQAVGRAAERTSIAVSVDAHPARIWLRNLRGCTPCPCSTDFGDASPATPSGKGKISIVPGVGDDLGGPDSGYPYPNIPPIRGSDIPQGPPDGADVPSFLDDTARLLLGNGRRCGICWGTGWIDGFHLWGGIRVVCCIADTLYACIDEGNPDVDLNSQTPSMLGPEDGDTSLAVNWKLDIPPAFRIVDALRVRDGLKPAVGNWLLQVKTARYTKWTDASTVFNLDYSTTEELTLNRDTLPIQFKLILGQGARVSHIEFVLRSEPLINVQMPQIQMTASAELVAPFITEEVELDPVVGYIERGSVLELPGRSGRVGSVWTMSDIMVKKDAQGTIFGVVGSARNVQPTEVLAAASLEDSLLLGTLEPGLASRGLESTGAGEPSGLEGKTDDSFGAVIRGTQKRTGGGASPSRGIINIGAVSGEEF